MQEQIIQELRDEIATLRATVENLSNAFYKNNFSSSISYTKDAIFQTRLRVPVYSSAPSVCEVGDLIAIAGKLYICTVANTTFTLVGSQT